MEFFGIGIYELIVIIVLTMLVVGPERLPQTIGQLARWIKQVRSYSTNLRSDFAGMIAGLEGEYGELSKEIQDLRQEMRGISGSVNAEFRSVGDAVEGRTVPAPAALPPASPPPQTPPPPPPNKRNAGDWWDPD